MDDRFDCYDPTLRYARPALGCPACHWTEQWRVIWLDSINLLDSHHADVARLARTTKRLGDRRRLSFPSFDADINLR
ncbi:hypothetical protein CKO51_16260 [Rhodopirellula sp. SM50]|nr:hypothetical protein CKO51_16260 [Rhodopirellula sp. SM50]